MNSSIYKFLLDLHNTQSQISLPVTKGDTARVFLIRLSDGGLPYVINDGCLAKIEIKRPTGTFLEAFCAIEKNTTIKYDFSQDEITKKTAIVDGIHDCSMTLYDSEGNKIGSPRFTMVVSDRVINSDDVNLSDDDLTAIDAMIAAEASRQAAEIGRVNAEAERVAAEEERKRVAEGLLESIDEGLTEVGEFLEEKIAKMDEAIEYVDNLGIPAVTEEDEGKILQVKGGKWDAVEIEYVEDGEF
jgi:hypothetical protein